MRNLLVAVDRSDCARRALDYAIGQSSHYPIFVHLVYVNLVPVNYENLRAYLSRKENRQFTQRQSREALGPAARKLERAGVAHKASVLWGDVAPEIVRAASRLKCDSIVMGTRGMGAVRNLVLGSVATKVVHLSKIPVTLVR